VTFCLVPVWCHDLGEFRMYLTETMAKKYSYPNKNNEAIDISPTALFCHSFTLGVDLEKKCSLYSTISGDPFVI